MGTIHLSPPSPYPAAAKNCSHFRFIQFIVENSCSLSSLSSLSSPSSPHGKKRRFKTEDQRTVDFMALFI